MKPSPSPPQINLPERQQFDGSGPFSPYEDVVSSASDTEYQHALEVIFDPQNSHRRKSSIVMTENPASISQRRQNTECFVHTLLESQRKHGNSQSGALDGIAETLENRRIDSGSGTANEDTLVEHKGGKEAENGVDVGQEDEEAWKKGSEASQQRSDKMEVVSGEDPNALHSRLLTKKQLSDMAWGVRELSKRLGSIRLKLKVRTVFLLTKAHDETLIGNTRDVVKWLLSPEREVRYTVWVEDNLRDNKKFNSQGLMKEMKEQYDSKNENDVKLERRLRYWTNEICRTRPHTFDFVVTLGGDGTVLYASWLFQRIVPPVLSFALGSLGFLTKFDYDDYPEHLTKAFRDGVTISLRLRFEGTVMRSQKRKRSRIENGEKQERSSENTPSDEREQEPEEDEGESSESRDLVEELVGEEKEDERTHRPDGTYEILNDIVVDRGPNPTMSSTEIFGDDEHFTSVQADGVCVATPTGSTAYNLAAGGSLCHPENPVILVTAICAHTLSFRPIILPDTIVLRVGVPYDARTSSWASFDGRERVELRPGDYVTISASRYPFANVMPQGRRSEDWVNSISGKLGWNTRQRQKSYKEWSK
ncbi:related to UTR1 (associated with ferric reductase activity) [Rhynchosporium agropyri]|uniref:Related to UTR1 (Associated with ferric reductase activity) n=1 Tax=Rhynchosporium agropyri TaxID=914238 RepID=A0A1E1L3K6_9HELO|nr:related to UTR1 (associated with ferric reductase activity) [Rhynchosporium agropyri]